MGADTKFYTPGNLSFVEAILIIEKTLGCEVEPNSHRITDFESGYFGITYKQQHRAISFGNNIRDFDPKQVHTVFSLGCSVNSVEILTLIGEQLGGWLDENDCDDKPNIYIEKKGEPIELNNRQKLLRSLASTTGYDEAVKILEIIQDNKSEILALNFGVDET